jgi:hypothetical protein
MVWSRGWHPPFETIAQKIDGESGGRRRLADWHGHQPREQVIKCALYDLLHNVPQTARMQEVERLFNIIYQQNEY